MRRLKLPSFLLGGLCAGIITLGLPLGAEQFTQVEVCTAAEQVVEPSAERWNLTAVDQSVEPAGVSHTEIVQTCQNTLVKALSSFGKMGIGINMIAIAIALAGVVWITQMLIEFRRRA